MSTFELLIVFAALMAVISLVAIAIDWVGRPLRHRRFIPKIYRYDDERGTDPAATPMVTNPVAAGARSVAGPMPTAVATVARPERTRSDRPNRDRTRQTTTSRAKTGASSSPFSEQIDDISDRSVRDLVASTKPVAAAPEWTPDMALDARAGDRKPTVAVKAERYWRTMHAHLGAESHFDADSCELMKAGRPPRRRNPRTGDTESAELVGLRSASTVDDVRMLWPDEAVDPWSST